MQKRYKTFNNKNLVDYHDLYVQIDTSLIADASENFKMCYNEYMNLILLNFYQQLD